MQFSHLIIVEHIIFALCDRFFSRLQCQTFSYIKQLGPESAETFHTAWRVRSDESPRPTLAVLCLLGRLSAFGWPALQDCYCSLGSLDSVQECL